MLFKTDCIVTKFAGKVKRNKRKYCTSLISTWMNWPHPMWLGFQNKKGISEFSTENACPHIILFILMFIKQTWGTTFPLLV